MSAIIRVIALLILAVSIVVPVLAARKEPGKRFGFQLAGIVAGLILLLVSFSFVIVPTGYTGVRITFGQIDQRVVPNGFNWKLPFIQDVELVNNKQQDITFDSQIWSETSDRTAIYYEDVTVTYQISTDKSSWIYANVANYKDNLVSPTLVSSAIKSSSKSLHDLDATNRAMIEPLVMENIQKSLDEKYGERVVLVNKVVISNADFEESYNEAIAARQRAQLNAEQQAIENQKAIDKAAAEATVTRTRAEAEAAARLIQAEAEAKANELLEKSLTDPVLRQRFIDCWDGKLPAYIGSDNNDLLLQLGIGSVSEAETQESVEDYQEEVLPEG